MYCDKLAEALSLNRHRLLHAARYREPTRNLASSATLAGRTMAIEVFLQAVELSELPKRPTLLTSLGRDAIQAYNLETADWAEVLFGPAHAARLLPRSKGTS